MAGRMNRLDCRDFELGAEIFRRPRTYLRATTFAHYRKPATEIIAAEDLEDDVHVVANALRNQHGQKADVEIFQWSGDLASARVEADRRAAEGRVPNERRVADATHDWAVARMVMTPPGTLIAMPEVFIRLPAETLRQILEAVRQHPAWRNHSFFVVSGDQKIVQMVEGRVEIKEPTEEMEEEEGSMEEGT
jgi:hypothetical protein